jgi:hypothetical protein
MTNRKRILQTSTVDFLMELNNNLDKADKAGYYKLCIMQALGLIDCYDRCHQFETCFKCIQKWLNEEEKSR